ncbi:hypothetical protein ES703_88340 [subsurface metagenome]
MSRRKLDVGGVKTDDGHDLLGDGVGVPLSENSEDAGDLGGFFGEGYGSDALLGGGGESGIDGITKKHGTFLGDLLTEEDTTGDLGSGGAGELIEEAKFESGFAGSFPEDRPDVKTHGGAGGIGAGRGHGTNDRPLGGGRVGGDVSGEGIKNKLTPGAFIDKTGRFCYLTPEAEDSPGPAGGHDDVGTDLKLGRGGGASRALTSDGVGRHIRKLLYLSSLSLTSGLPKSSSMRRTRASMASTIFLIRMMLAGLRNLSQSQRDLSI